MTDISQSSSMSKDDVDGYQMGNEGSEEASQTEIIPQDLDKPIAERKKKRESAD